MFTSTRRTWPPSAVPRRKRARRRMVKSLAAATPGWILGWSAMANGSASPRLSCSSRKRSKTGDAASAMERTRIGVSQQRQEPERFKSFSYEELTKRDKLNLDIFWLKDESLEDSANLPAPDIIAAEIVEDLQAALAQFAEIASDLKK